MASTLVQVKVSFLWFGNVDGRGRILGEVGIRHRPVIGIDTRSEHRLSSSSDKGNLL